MTCDDYQIAFDQQQAGASSAIPAAELDAHVAACTACTAYVALSEKVSNSMMNTTAMSSPVRDLATLQRRIGQQRRRLLLNRVIGPVTVSLTMLIVRLQGGTPAFEAIVTSIVAGVLFGTLLFFIGRRKIAGLAALERKSYGDLTHGFRDQLDRELKAATFTLWFIPLLSLIMSYEELLAGQVPSTFHLVLVALLLLQLPFAFVQRRRLLRERALLVLDR